MIGSRHLAAFFNAHAATLILFARQWLDRSAAEDVVQDAFISLMGLRNAPDNPKAWLYKAVRNAAISHVRSSSRRNNREMRLAQNRGELFESGADDLIDAAAAEESLLSLASEQREVIVMRLWAQMTLTEIAQVTGDAVSTLFSRYRSGLAEIRRIMESSCPTKKKI